jgi:protein SCO1/2
MSKPRKIIVIMLWIVAAIAMVGVLALRSWPPARQSAAAEESATFPTPAGRVIADPSDSPGAPLPVLYDAPQFSLTDQDGKTFTRQQLLGHPWIADFFFTTCASLCPAMSGHMADFQDKISPDVRLVSFSVDPARDTPPVLKDYAARYHAQPGRWIFLTGDEASQEAVIRGMKLIFSPAEGINPIQHDQRFILVDARGRLRAVYDSLSNADLDKLVRDANELAAHPEESAP